MEQVPSEPPGPPPGSWPAAQGLEPAFLITGKGASSGPTRKMSPWGTSSVKGEKTAWEPDSGVGAVGQVLPQVGVKPLSLSLPEASEPEPAGH